MTLSFIENARYLNEVIVVLQSENGRTEGFLGALIGAVVGFVVGAIVNSVVNDANQFTLFRTGDETNTMSGFIAGGFLLGLVAIPF